MTPPPSIKKEEVIFGYEIAVFCYVCCVDVNVEGRPRAFYWQLWGKTVFGRDVRSSTREGHLDRAPFKIKKRSYPLRIIRPPTVNRWMRSCAYSKLIKAYLYPVHYINSPTIDVLFHYAIWKKKHFEKNRKRNFAWHAQIVSFEKMNRSRQTFYRFRWFY